MKKPITYQLSMLLAIFMISTITSAGVYKWVDENGRVHFGSRPPTDAETSEVKIRKQNPTVDVKEPVDRKLQRSRYLEQRQKEKADRKEKKAKALEEKRRRDKSCAYSKDKLKEYTSSGRLYEPQSDGSRRWLSDKDRDKAIAEMRREVKKWCK